MNFHFSGALLRFIDFNKTVTVEAETVRDGIVEVATRFPQAKAVLLDPEGEVRPVHQIFLNGQQLAMQQLSTRVVPSDTVDVVTPVAGG